MGFLQIRCVSSDALRFAIDFKGIYSVSKILEGTKSHVYIIGKKIQAYNIFKLVYIFFG